MSEYNNDVADFHVGQRVELHPAHDLWMIGARYGVVTKLGRFLVWVRLDKTGKVHGLSALNLRGID